MQALALLVLLSMAVSANACTCAVGPPPHDQSHCNAEFGILVYVEDGGHVYGLNRVYKIKLLVAYHLGSQNRDLLDKTHVYTATNSAACGVNLQKGKYYLLTGNYQQHGPTARFYITLCDYVKEFIKNPQGSIRDCNNGEYKSSG